MCISFCYFVKSHLYCIQPFALNTDCCLQAGTLGLPLYPGWGGAGSICLPIYLFLYYFIFADVVPYSIGPLHRQKAQGFFPHILMQTKRTTSDHSRPVSGYGNHPMHIVCPAWLASTSLLKLTRHCQSLKFREACEALYPMEQIKPHPFVQFQGHLDAKAG